MMGADRQALGSDLWPCTWANDDALYCAWGDGGGFDGNDDHIGRVSLGFARVIGIPHAHGPVAIAGKNVWGQLPYAEHQASFGGKVDSLVALDGFLYAIGNIWTAANDRDPVHRSGDGPIPALLRSPDGGHSWSILSRSSDVSRGSFLNFGRADAGAFDHFVYIYYLRTDDDNHIYLKRIRRSAMRSGATDTGAVQYLARVERNGRSVRWSERAVDAHPVFTDRDNVTLPHVVYDAGLHRFILTSGHSSRRGAGASEGTFGLFEARHPWGPWSTVGYYENWGGIEEATRGDFLGVEIPSKWISRDGTTFWAIFSGAGAYDAFNLIQARFTVRRWWQIL